MCLSSSKTTIQGYPIFETDFHELAMEEIVSLGFPIDEVSFHGPTLMEQTFTNFILRKSVQLIWNRLNWFPCFFFQSKRFRHYFGGWNCFPMKIYQQKFIYEIQINRFPLNSFQPLNHAFLVFLVITIKFLGFPIVAVDFHNFFMDEINISGFSVKEVHFRRCSMIEGKFHGFLSIKLNSIDFQSASSFLMEFSLRLTCFHGFIFS